MSRKILKRVRTDLLVRGLTTEADVLDSEKKSIPELENCMIKLLEIDPFAIYKNEKSQDYWEIQIRKIGEKGQLEVVQIKDVKTEIHNEHNEKLRILSIKGNSTEKPIELTKDILKRIENIM